MHNASLAELEALCGRDRVGAPRVPDDLRPHAFALERFRPDRMAGRILGMPTLAGDSHCKRTHPGLRPAKGGPGNFPAHR